MNAALLVVLTIFIVITAIAVAWQTIILVSLARVLTRLALRSERVLNEVEGRLPPLLTESEAILRDSRAKIDIAGTHLIEITGLARDQMRRADELFAEISDRARLQVIRLDQAISTTFEKVEETTEMVQRTVLRPIRDAAAIIHGVRTGLDFFLRRRPSPPALSPQDEEMFI